MAYTSKITKTFDFDNEKVDISFRRLRRNEFLELQEFASIKDGQVVMSFKKQKDMLDFMEKLLPEVIFRLYGLTIDGETVNYEKHNANDRQKEFFNLIISEMYFMELIKQFMGELFESSVLSNEEGADTEKK